MPAGARFIFFLQDKQNRFWGVNPDTGAVTLTANPYPLVYSPDGWQDTGIKNIRNKKYWAVDRSVSIPFKYVQDGAKIVKHVFYTKGPEEPLFLAIMELRLDYTPGTDYGYWYKLTYKGEVDTTSFSHNGALVTTPLIEEGLAKHLKANENTAYEFDLSTGINVRHDGIILKEKHNFLIQQIAHTDTLTADDHLPGIIFTNKEGFASGVATFSVFYDQNAPTDLTTDSRYFMITTQAITGMRLFGSFRVVPTSTGTLTIDLVSSAGASISLVNQSVSADTTINIDETFNTAANEKFFIVANFDTGGATHAIGYIETTMQIEFESRFAETTIKALRPQYLFSEFIYRMTGGDYTAQDCPYFGDLQNFDKVFTSGDGIRGLADAKLKMSFTQFLSFWNTYDEVGLKEEGLTVLLDRKAALTDYSDPVDIGEVNRPKVDHDKSYSFNELVIGYPDVKSEEGMLNGKNEFNTTSIFSIGTTKSPRKHEKTSQVRASCYDIENIRISVQDKDTTDNRADGESYVLHIEDTETDGAFNLDRSLNSFLLGVDQKESIFNVDLSPKRCLNRSGDYLRSCFYKCDSKVLKFISADRNSEMEYINGSDVVQEKADVVIGSLDAPFFVPVLIAAEVETIDDLLDLDPSRAFVFSFDGQDYEGLSMENGINPDTRKKQTFQILSSPNNDLTKLIEYFG
jgi:hypothetical protein